MKKKILAVFTGGTICTTINKGIMSPDGKAVAALCEFYKTSDSFCKDDIIIENGKSFGILSENMTIAKWNELICYFKEILPTLSEYSGIIIAHGTDTLAYSSALFSLLLKGICIPVFFVSSNNSIMLENSAPNPNANGCDNFRAAVECIYKGITPDVYVTYKNPKDKRTYLHKGAELIQCDIYDDNFYSANALDITDNNCFDKAKGENILPFDSLPIMAITELCDGILKIEPYVGMNYEHFDLTKVRAVLHGTYHSGTSCVVRTALCPDINESSVLYFFDKCAKLNIPFYYSPSDVSDDNTVYASVPFIKEYSAHGQKINILYGDTNELAYAKLLIKYS